MKRYHTKQIDVHRFIDYAIGFQSMTCLPWPFGRNSAGYGHFTVDGRWTLAHRLICERVHGEAPADRSFAAHECGNGHNGCVNPNHLRWKSPKENSADMTRHGTVSRGADRHNVKLTENDIRAIRSRKGLVSAKDLASVYSVTPGAIHAVWRRRSWAWVSSDAA